MTSQRKSENFPKFELFWPFYELGRSNFQKQYHFFHPQNDPDSVETSIFRFEDLQNPGFQGSPLTHIPDTELVSFLKN